MWGRMVILASTNWRIQWQSTSICVCGKPYLGQSELCLNCHVCDGVEPAMLTPNSRSCHNQVTSLYIDNIDLYSTSTKYLEMCSAFCTWGVEQINLWPCVPLNNWIIWWAAVRWGWWRFETNWLKLYTTWSTYGHVVVKI